MSAGEAGTLQPAVDSVDSVVSDAAVTVSAGQTPSTANGWGTLGLCPPPETEVDSVDFQGLRNEIDSEDPTIDANRNEIESISAETDSVDSETDSTDHEVFRLLDQVGTADDPYRDGGKWAYADGENLGGRVFFITQNAALGGRQLLTAERIAAALERKGFASGRWAWIKHDKDTYTQDDVKRNRRAVLGARKEDHFHIVVDRKSFATLGAIARAFGVPPNQVEIKPQGAFLDLVEYLTHENPGQVALGKHVYADEEVHANFDWRPALDDHKLARSFKAGKRANTKKLEALFLAVNRGELTLRQVREQEPELYTAKGTIAHLQKLRDDYLLCAPLPPFRTNYYIGGPARSGKSTVAVVFAETLARALYPDLAFDEAIYVAGRPGVAFQSYDGQPIVVWDDYRPLSIIEAIGGDVRQRDSIWPVLDISPKRVEVNKKYGSVTLLNAVNIITGVQPYRMFLDGLAGEYIDRKTGERVEVEDKNQAYGRFPFVSEVTPETIDFYLNRGFAGATGSYQDYEPVARIKANMKRIIDTIDALPDEAAKARFREAAGDRMLGSMVAAHRELRGAAPAVSLDAALAELEATTAVQTAGDLTAAAETHRAAVDALMARWRTGALPCPRGILRSPVPAIAYGRAHGLTDWAVLADAALAYRGELGQEPRDRQDDVMWSRYGSADLDPTAAAVPAVSLALPIATGDPFAIEDQPLEGELV